MGKFAKSLKHRGNVNRIMEMHEQGNGVHAIVGTFRDHGITVTTAQVEGIIGSNDELSAKALPKSAVKALNQGTRLAFSPT